MSSLGLSLQKAGCRNSVQSLWTVNDASTAELMRLFYQYLKDGDGKATALSKAKTSFVQSAPTKWKHPYYWAGFVYYGNDLPLTLDQPFLLKYVIIIAAILLLLVYFIKRSPRK